MTRAAMAGAVITGACVLLAACGSTASPSSEPATSSPAHVASKAKVSLDVTFAATPTSPAAHYTLTCEPAGGTTPDPAAACTKLLSGQNVLALPPRHAMCPMISKNDGRVTITGSYLGRPMHMTVFTGGCNPSFWSELKSIFR